MTSRSSKMLQYINWRMRVTIADSRSLLGTFMAFDKHMNLVLGDCEEFRKIKAKKGGEEKEEKRTLGLVLLRGENVISLQAETPPPPKPRAQAGRGGPGTGRATGRGVAAAPLGQAPQGLSTPMKGVGGPAQSMMMPVVSSAPMTYGGRGGNSGSSSSSSSTTSGSQGRGQPTPPMPSQQQMQSQMMGRGQPMPPQMMGRGMQGPPMQFNPMMPPPNFQQGPPMMMQGRGNPMMMQGSSSPPSSSSHLSACHFI